MHLRTPAGHFKTLLDNWNLEPIAIVWSVGVPVRAIAGCAGIGTKTKAGPRNDGASGDGPASIILERVTQRPFSYQPTRPMQRFAAPRGA